MPEPEACISLLVEGVGRLLLQSRMGTLGWLHWELYQKLELRIHG